MKKKDNFLEGISIREGSFHFDFSNISKRLYYSSDKGELIINNFGVPLFFGVVFNMGEGNAPRTGVGLKRVYLYPLMSLESNVGFLYKNPFPEILAQFFTSVRHTSAAKIAHKNLSKKVGADLAYLGWAAASKAASMLLHATCYIQLRNVLKEAGAFNIDQ